MTENVHPADSDSEEIQVSDFEAFFGSDSGDDSPFEGFSCREQRRFLTQANETELFEAKPIVCRNDSNLSSNSKLSCDSFSTTINCKRKLSYDSSDSISSIEGEPGEQLFERAQKIRDEKLNASSETESESDDSRIEGEAWIQPSKTQNSDDDHHSAQKSDEPSSMDENKQPQTRNLRAKKRRSVIHPLDLCDQDCCKDDCITKLTKIQLVKAREHFLETNPSFRHQRQFCLDWFERNQRATGEFSYSISGVSTCHIAWAKILGIPIRTFYSWKSDYLNGRRCADHGASLTVKASPVTEAALNFLTIFFEENCDFLPTGDLMHLPSTSNKSEIFEEMQDTLKSQGQPCCSKALFLKLWKQHFPQVKIPKADRFSQCDTCANISKDLNSTRNPYIRAAVFQRRKDHRAFVKKERSAYTNKAIQGHRYPQRFFSVAVDGMDQNKTELPHSKYRHKSLDTAWKLKVHVVGSMVHGRPPIAFLDYQQFPHDSNLTCNVLLQIFWIHREFLPNTVFVQLDNTYRDNKNQYLIGLMAYLVETCVFDTVEVAFLPKGHTHIDVDQLFSRLSVAISRNGCLTFQDLTRLLQSCYKQAQGETTQEGATAQYAQMDQIFAIREWIIPHMHAVHGLLNHHHFRFTRDEDEKCVLDYKPWCSDPEFDRQKWPPLTILTSTPQEVPEMIKPNYSLCDLGRIRKMVEKCQTSGVLKEEEVSEWVEYLDLEDDKEKRLEGVEQIAYSKASGNLGSHKEGVVYMKCRDDRWMVDDLRERERPVERTSPQLSDVLKRSQALELGEGLLPVYLGNYKNAEKRAAKEKKRVYNETELDKLKIGMFVALDLPKYKDERPLIGKVMQIGEEGDTIEVLWYYGTWTGKWKVHKVNRGPGRKKVENREVVQRDSIKRFNFRLTKHDKLGAKLKDELRAVYQSVSDN